MRLEPVILPEHKNIKELLSYYMGKNTPERQADIIQNLRVEKELDFKDEPAELAEAA
jgi:topoisomerase-4 subunit B